MGPAAKRLCCVIAVCAIFLPSRQARAQEYYLLGWSESGMHSFDKDFSKIVFLPPGNTVRAQLVIHDPGQFQPRVVTAGYTVEYSIPGNSFSAGKTNFWTYAKQLFGLAQTLPDNVGLSGKGLAGVLDTTGTFFEARGIPLTPFQDSNLVSEQPYQLIRLVARATGSSTILATTDVVIPVSNEIGCVQSGCHSSDQDVLNDHESVSGFNKAGPVLCASCHASNALGTAGTTSAGPFSLRIHNRHKSVAGTATAIGTCYKCHPGLKTQQLRDVMRNSTANPMVCQTCHGTMTDIVNSITAGRQPWIQEPTCGSAACHGADFSEQPGKLFRQSTGHGGLYCSACHGSPHAVQPTSQPNDNLQNVRLQGFPGVLRKCRLCHGFDLVGVPGPHGVLATSVSEDPTLRPTMVALEQNYPNPFNPSSTIQYSLPYACDVRLSIVDLEGREIARLVDGGMPSGTHRIVWNAGNSASGVYFARLQAAGSTATRKLVLLH
jgi:hypothetical protein